MDNLIDYRYFRGITELPNLNLVVEESTPSGEDVAVNLNEIDIDIAKFQKKLLVKLFGSEIVPTEVESLLVDEATLTSPIANYVFCNVLPKYQSRSTMGGEKIHNAQDSISISAKNKIDEIWNEMVEMLGEIREYLYDNDLEETYPTDFNSEIYKLSYFV